MRRQQQGGSKSIGNLQKGSGVLNKGFAIFQRNQQEQDANKQRSAILIRTLPFIKRKPTIENPNSNNEGGGIPNSQDLNTPKELEDYKQGPNQNQYKQFEFPQLEALNSSPRYQFGQATDSRNPSRQSIRYFVHNVGQSFGRTPSYHQSSHTLKRGGYRQSVDSTQQKEQPQQLTSNAGFLTYSQFQSASNTPMATAYYSTQAEKFSINQPKNNTQKQRFQNDNNSDQSPQDSFNDSQNFTDTQKQFFENFMQEVKPVFPNDTPVMSDNQINSEYTFKFQSDLNKLENPNSSIAFLNGFPHNFPLIESHYRQAVKFRDEYNQLKEQLRKEIDDMKQKYEKDVDAFFAEAKEASQKIAQEIQEDFVRHQTEQFALNKEITKLTRDKNSLENDIDGQLRRIRQLEDKLYGQEIFNLVPKDPYIQNMTLQNQRQDTFTPISQKRQTQTIKNIIH